MEYIAPEALASMVNRDQQDETDRVVRPKRVSKSTLSQRVAQQTFRARQKERKRQEQQEFEKQKKELEEEKQEKERLAYQLQMVKAENVQLMRRAEVAEECSTLLQESVKTFQRSLDMVCAGISSPRLESNFSSASALISSPTSQFGQGNHLRARSFPLVAPPPHIFKYTGKPQGGPAMSPISPVLAGTPDSCSLQDYVPVRFNSSRPQTEKIQVKAE